MIVTILHQHFIPEEMAIAFLKSMSIILKQGQRIKEIKVDVDKNKPEKLLEIIFDIASQGSSKYHIFHFAVYYKWFEENKFKYL